MILSSAYTKLKNHRFFSEFFTKKALAQLTKYLVVGFSTVGLEVLNIRIFTEYFGLWYLLSNTLAYIISFIFNFFLNRIWSFESKSNLKFQLGAYGILFIFNLFASNGIMYLLTSVIGLYYMISKLISIAMIVSWNFVLYKKVIYKDRG